jgi:hypothetical protein
VLAHAAASCGFQATSSATTDSLASAFSGFTATAVALRKVVAQALASIGSAATALASVVPTYDASPNPGGGDDQLVPTAGLMNLPRWHAIIRQGIEDEIVIPRGITIGWDNAPVDQPESSMWISAQILDGPVRSVDRGTTLRRRCSGKFRVNVHAPLNSGTKDAWRLVDDLALSFRAASDVGVRYGVPTARTVGRSGRHWLIVVDIPYLVDEIA